jgi:hypothetical protein
LPIPKSKSQDPRFQAALPNSIFFIILYALDLKMDKNTPEKPNVPEGLTKSQMVGFAMELGYVIALPIVGFGLLGKWLDHKMNHQVPWVTLIGIALAITLTTIWLTMKLKKYIK